jgi:23S rRNA pseudouridine1911/1915/1917 synthase
MRSIPVVFEDNWLYVVNKPSGLLTIPDPGRRTPSLIDILNDALKASNTPWRVHPCHRLDRDTSGLLILAKGKSIQKKMMDEFKSRSVSKRYTAFVQGGLPLNKGQVKNPIEGQFACTEYRVIGRHRDFTVLEARPLTGRRNQIRIHFKQLGHPIVGEDKFAFRRDFALRFKRLCLHASELEFTHPVTKERIALKSGLPADLTDFLKGHP